MKKIHPFLFLVFAVITNAQTNVGITGNVAGIYINEFHYDNDGADTGEFIEVAGPAGTDLSAYTLTLYNGSDNTAYRTIHLSGIIANEDNSQGAISFDTTNLQNGAPDGIALSQTGNTNIQFISYEGVISAADGPAVGLNSIDIMIAESATTPIGYSLEYDEMTTSWIVSTDNTPGHLTQGVILSVTNHTIPEVRIYPNPASNGIIHLDTNIGNIKKIAVFDSYGKQITNITTSENSINMSNLNNGIYFITISEDGKTVTKKLVIE